MVFTKQSRAHPASLTRHLKCKVNINWLLCNLSAQDDSGQKLPRALTFPAVPLRKVRFNDRQHVRFYHVPTAPRALGSSIPTLCANS